MKLPSFNSSTKPQASKPSYYYYRFPAIVQCKSIPNTGRNACLEKLEEEVAEVRQMIEELNKFHASGITERAIRIHAVEEVVDVMHACESLLRSLNVDDREFAEMIYQVITKNVSRGYYGED